jgi:hypothetical protein
MHCDTAFGDVTDSDAETECTQAGVTTPIGPNFKKAGETIGSDFAKTGETIAPHFTKTGETIRPDFTKAGEPIGPDFKKTGETMGPDFAKTGETIGPDFTKAGVAVAGDKLAGGEVTCRCRVCQCAMGPMPAAFVNMHCKGRCTCDGCGAKFAVRDANGLGVVGCRTCDRDWCASCQSKFGRRAQISAKRAASSAALVVAAGAEVQCRVLRDAGAETCGDSYAFGPERPRTHCLRSDRSKLWIAAPPEYAAGFTSDGAPGEFVSWALLPAGAPTESIVDHTASIARSLRATDGYVGKSNARDRPRPRATDRTPPKDNIIPDFCIRAPQTYHGDSWSRVGTTLLHYRLAVIVYVSRDQDEALGAESILQEGLPSAAGIRLANKFPYSPGRKVKKGRSRTCPPSAYYVYVTLRF